MTRPVSGSTLARPPRRLPHRHAAPAGTVRIRVATARDVPAVAAMRLALLAEARNDAALVDGAGRIARRMGNSRLRGDTGVTLVAVAARQVIGMVRCVEAGGSSLVRGERHAALVSAYVYPRFRRRGALRALVRAAEAWCRARGLGELRLHCGVDNVAGNAAWAALGFLPWEVRYRRPVEAR